MKNFMDSLSISFTFASISLPKFFLMLFRSLNQVARIVEARLAKIPKSHIVKYWHHCSLMLYKYLYFTKI